MTSSLNTKIFFITFASLVFSAYCDRDSIHIVLAQCGIEKSKEYHSIRFGDKKSVLTRKEKDSDCIDDDQIVLSRKAVPGYSLIVDTSYRIIVGVGPIFDSAANKTLSVLPRFFPDYYPVSIAWSSDKKYMAIGHHKSLKVVDLKNNKLVLDKKLNSRVDDLKFDRDTYSIFVLSERLRIGFWPRELLMAVSGHPVQYESFYLSMIDFSGNESARAKVGREVKYGQGRFVLDKYP